MDTSTIHDDINSLNVTFTLFDSVKQPKGRRITKPWSSFFKAFANVHDTAPAKKDNLKGWSAATFTGDHRNKGNTETVSAAVFDFDNAEHADVVQPDGAIGKVKTQLTGDRYVTIERAMALFPSLCRFLYTSWSHSDSWHHFRLVLPYTRAVSAAEQDLLWRALAQQFAATGCQIDISCKDSSRFWFIPCRRDDSFTTQLIDGAYLDVDALLAASPATETFLTEPVSDDTDDCSAADAPTARPQSTDTLLKRAEHYLAKMPGATSGAGGHNATLKAASALVRGFALEPSVAFTMLRDLYNPRCTPRWSDRELQHKVDSAAKDGKTPMGNLLTAPVSPTVKVDCLALVQQVCGVDQAGQFAALLLDRSFLAALDQGGAVLVDRVFTAMKAAGISKAAIRASIANYTKDLGPSSGTWETGLGRSASGAVLGTVNNALLVMENDERIKGAVGYDELRAEPAWVAAPPWMPPPQPACRPVTDEDATRLVAWLDATHGIRIPIPVAHAVIDASAKANSFHGVLQYLTGIKQDSTERVAGRLSPGWLTTYLGVPDSPYVRAVGRKFLIGAVARIRRPGCKLDTMLVLEGTQGKKKSTAIETLFGVDFFSDQLSDITTKDASSDLRGKWVIEWAELDNLSRTESSAVKKYISRRIDDYRPSYGRRNVRIPRQCVFVGSTNKEAYLKDETGNRRFWPVTCTGIINIDALTRDRDALWAEAVALFDNNEPWWFTAEDADVLLEAEREQSARRVEDPWEAIIAKALDEREDMTTDDDMNVMHCILPAMNETTTDYILTTALGVPAERQTRALQMRIGEVMHALEWERVQRRVGNKRTWVYARSEPIITVPVQIIKHMACIEDNIVVQDVTAPSANEKPMMAGETATVTTTTVSWVQVTVAGLFYQMVDGIQAFWAVVQDTAGQQYRHQYTERMEETQEILSNVPTTQAVMHVQVDGPGSYSLYSLS